MKKMLAICIAGATLATSLGGFVASASAAPNSAPCSNTKKPSDIDHSAYPTATSSDNIESGSSASCTNLGLLAKGQKADYYCYTNGTGGTWTYLRDASTNYVGWVKDSLLPGDGSLTYCGF